MRSFAFEWQTSIYKIFFKSSLKAAISTDPKASQKRFQHRI